MKKILAAALAAAVATTTLVGVAEAQPFGWKGKYDNHHVHRGPPAWQGHHGNWGWRRSYDPGPAIIAGSIFGAIGALAAGNAYRGDYYSGPQSHVAWCESRYRTYNPATDTYFVRPGVPAVCHSPYYY
jgi:hypothetical protein